MIEWGREILMKKNLVIDRGMKELWPEVRVGCLQYRVKVEKKNEEMWKYLKRDISEGCHLRLRYQ